MPIFLISVWFVICFEFNDFLNKAGKKGKVEPNFLVLKFAFLQIIGRFTNEFYRKNYF